jgi:phosphoribosylformimino-5-aminoimidazole carboxamide ribotide isomerase
MQIIPAIDIRNGKVVRLKQGRAEDETAYAISPADAAKRWAAAGATMVHVVDLDGAMSGEFRNIGLVARIAKECGIRVELGGGLRDLGAIKKALDAGVTRVVIGTKALDESFLKDAVKSFPGSIVVGIDSKCGIVRTDGWLAKSAMKAEDLAKKVFKLGVRTVIHTDIASDGMMRGANIAGLKAILKASACDVIASGGISTLEDIRKLADLKDKKLVGAIIGKALYEGKIDLREAIKAFGDK